MINNIGEAYNSLLRIHEHLDKKGWLILDLFNPLQSFKNEDSGMPRVLRTAEDGNQKVVCTAVTSLDMYEQIMQGSYKYELLEDNEHVSVLEDEFKMRWYGKYEFKLMLEKAGFINISIEPQTIMSSHSGTLVYHAQKP